MLMSVDEVYYISKPIKYIMISLVLRVKRPRRGPGESPVGLARNDIIAIKSAAPDPRRVGYGQSLRRLAAGRLE